MSVKCHEIISAMEILAPKNLAESWDNVGLMLGSQTDNINKIRTFICPYLPILFLNFLYFFIIFIQNI